MRVEIRAVVKRKALLVTERGVLDVRSDVKRGNSFVIGVREGRDGMQVEVKSRCRSEGKTTGDLVIRVVKGLERRERFSNVGRLQRGRKD